MSMCAPSQTFEDAVKYLSNASSLSAVSNAVKLELYGLYKYLTVAPTPITSRPSIFDMTGRAKWDAWSATGKTYGDRATNAEARYLDIARELGWKEDMAPGEQNVWDGDSDSASRKSGGGGGLGKAVSTMRSSEEHNDSVMSGFAISGNAQEMSSFLDANPKVDINTADENGYTPLHLACDRGNLEIVKLLLSRGADTRLKDADEFTALELAEISGHDDIVSILKSTSTKPD